jgi:hypothetical protein
VGQDQETGKKHHLPSSFLLSQVEQPHNLNANEQFGNQGDRLALQVSPRNSFVPVELNYDSLQRIAIFGVPCLFWHWSNIDVPCAIVIMI